MITQSYLFEFVEKLNQVAAQNAKKMEELIYEDPSSAIIKARIYAEEIIKDVFIREEINEPYIFTLSDRIRYLSNQGYFTPYIQSAFDTIRLFGNKAAHDGAFDDISKALKLHKVMYDIAVWYCDVYSIVQISIPSYSQPKPKKQNLDDIKSLIQDQFLELIREYIPNDDQENCTNDDKVNNIQEIKKSYENNDQIINEILQLDPLPEGRSQLHRELTRLRSSSQEAVENASSFSKFKNYLHIERNIQKNFEEILNKYKNDKHPRLILLCGNVGDGKSHLLAYIKENKPYLLEGYQIFNDATESFSPEKNAIETLEEILSDFSDQKIECSRAKVILAINMGVLHNFIMADHSQYTFEKLHTFINESNLFSQQITTTFSDDSYTIVSFGDYHMYELSKEGAVSSFFEGVLQKVFNEDEGNPFYQAYIRDVNNGINTMLHENYQFLLNRQVQKQISSLIIETIVKFKLVISARAFLNFIADIIIPDQLTNINMLTPFEKLEQSMPNFLFKRKDRSDILKYINQLDPINIRSSHLDELIINLHTLSDWESIIKNIVTSKIGQKWLLPLVADGKLSIHSLTLFTKYLIRITFLCSKEFSDQQKDNTYYSYLKYLYFFNKGNVKELKPLFETIKDAIFKWNGSPIKDHIFINNSNERFRISQVLKIKPNIATLNLDLEDGSLESFKNILKIGFLNGKDEEVALEIDFSLYQLLLRVVNGYCPNKKDEEDAIQFVEFIDKILKFGSMKNELFIHFPRDKRIYKLYRDDYGSFAFERE